MNTHALHTLITFFMMVSSALAFSPFAEFQAIELEAIHRQGKPLPRKLSSAMHFLPENQVDNSVGTTTEAPILVVGATGKVGRKVVYDLLDEQIPVRALVRNPEKAGELFFEYLGGRSCLELVVCDLDTADKESVMAATAGCECVINVSGKEHEVFKEHSQQSSGMPNLDSIRKLEQ